VFSLYLSSTLSAIQRIYFVYALNADSLNRKYSRQANSRSEIGADLRASIAELNSSSSKTHGGRPGQAKDLRHTVKSHSVANAGTNSGYSISKDSVACGLYPILKYHCFRNSLLG